MTSGKGRGHKLNFESIMLIAGVGVAGWLAYNHFISKGVVKEQGKAATQAQMLMGEAECRANGGLWQRGVCVSPYARKGAFGSYY